MTALDPRADKVVRDAVEAFIDGRLAPEFTGEAVFETKNSRYRLLDGVVFAAPDETLIGAELVGWLCDSERRCLVESAWQPGCRAVLVDRRNERNIIVTSTTRLLTAEGPGSGPYHPPSSRAPQADFRSWHPPPVAPATPASVPPPPFLPRIAPIIPSTPPPAGVHLSPMPPAPLRRPALHLPPRPLPPPAPPPRRPSPSHPDAPIDAAAAGADWELSSAEVEIESDTMEPSTLRHDPLPDAEADPFPLVRPTTPGPHRRS